jgi:signal peptidase I
VSGVVVAFNRFYYQKKIEASGGGNRATDVLIEYSRSFFPVLLFVLVIRSFIFEPFRIPSGSMIPTLLQGDYIFVKKYSYGLRWPVIEKKFYETGLPQRGDVVVFRLPSDPSVNYIKRVVGLPGDTIVYQDHQLYINGQQMPLTKHPDTRLQESGLIFIEELDGRKHEIRIGEIPETHLVGEAVRIWMHMDGIEWPEWGRIGTKIQ